jgi:hypothetical protein
MEYSRLPGLPRSSGLASSQHGGADLLGFNPSKWPPWPLPATWATAGASRRIRPPDQSLARVVVGAEARGSSPDRRNSSAVKAARRNALHASPPALPPPSFPVATVQCIVAPATCQYTATSPSRQSETSPQSPHYRASPESIPTVGVGSGDTTTNWGRERIEGRDGPIRSFPAFVVVSIPDGGPRCVGARQRIGGGNEWETAAKNGAPGVAGDPLWSTVDMAPCAAIAAPGVRQPGCRPRRGGRCGG